MNSEHRKKTKNARRNIDSRVESTDGDKYPSWRVWIQRARRSAVTGKCFGKAFLNLLIIMLMWACEMEGAGAPENSLMKKFIPLRYTWIVDVLIWTE